MAKGAEAFRSIGEVAKLIGVAPHVLRYWETQFSLLKPMKRGDGRRYYRPDDVRLAAGICEILRDEGLTIRGAKKLLAKDRGEAVRQRGALKLGEVFEPASQDEGASGSGPDVHTTEQMTGSQGANGSDAVNAAAEADGPSTHAPRARMRKRPAARASDTLPLFPEDGPQNGADAPPPAQDATRVQPVPVDARQAEWLGRLVRLRSALSAQTGGADLPSASQRQARRLLDAIADHF